MEEKTLNEKFEAVTGDYLPEYAAKIPEAVLEGLVNYLYYGNQPGHFLTAVLTNDLFEAVGRGDDKSIAAIRELVQLIYNRVPSPSWGDKEKVKAWRAARQEARRSAEEMDQLIQAPFPDVKLVTEGAE